MYRQYENSYDLEKVLEKAREEYRKAADLETLFNLHEDIEYLEERVNFAWADDEDCL